MVSIDKQKTLPPGQMALGHFPRYGLFQYAGYVDHQPAALSLEIDGDVQSPLIVDAAILQTLPRVEQTCDLNCVTTWSRRDLHWSGYRFKDFYERILLPQAQPAPDVRYVVLRSRDGYRTYFLLEDALADDVLLVDRLDDVSLGWEHGAPLRLVAPAHYAFRSAKHLCRIEFVRNLDGYRSPALHWTEHPRARVALEERGRWLPAWFYRYFFRLFIPWVVWWYGRAGRRVRSRVPP